MGKGRGVVVGRFCVLLVLGVGRPSGALLFSDFYFILWFPSRPADGRKQQRAGKARFAWVPFLSFCPLLPGFPRADDGINGASSTSRVKAWGGLTAQAWQSLPGADPFVKMVPCR
jgi:hypothetical protein